MRSRYRGKKLLAGGKRTNLHAPGVQQAAKRPGYGGVVVDDVYERGDDRQSVTPSHEEPFEPIFYQKGGVLK